MNSLLEKFCTENKDKYGVSFDELKLICVSPFRVLKDTISQGLMKDLRFWWFGIFKVSAARLKYNKASVEKGYKEGTLSEKAYKERMEVFNNYDKIKNKNESKDNN